ncbi:MAG TPA: hypothetical protein VK988_20650 [Acidimicrobiales bacterium]|nr:hypothetical protein [Acidimicrobiales bacterium]
MVMLIEPVAERAAHHVGGDAHRQREGGGGVAGVVEADAGQPAGANVAVEGISDGLGAQRGAVLMG